jgi:PPOX class probable F420-dependent enzyme
MLEPAIRDLARGPNFATIAVHLPSGRIASHVMWIDADDEHLLVNTEIHRLKYEAVQRDPNVTVTVWDRDDPYRYAEVRGEVVGEIRGDPARDHIDELSRRYQGHDYQNPIESERIILQIEPLRQRSRKL